MKHLTRALTFIFILCLSHAGTQVALANIVAAQPELVFSAIQGNPSQQNTVLLTNIGAAPINITGRTITGANAANFAVNAPAPGVITVNPGQSIPFTLTFTPPVGVFNVQRTATLTVNTTNGPVTVALYGLALQGSAGGNEPPLQLAIRVAGFDIDVGSSALISRPVMAAPVFENYTLGEEVVVPLFQKAGPGNVTMTPIMRFSPAEELPYGWYVPNGTANPPLNEVNAIANTDGVNFLNHQRLYPVTETANTIFDPGTVDFGLYVSSASFGRESYTEEALNTGPRTRAARMFPARDRNGVLIPNSYIVTYEDAANGDYQDYVFLLGNVVPAVLDPPIAADDTAVTTVPTAVNIGVLVNDTGVDAPLNPAAVAIVTAPPASEGTAVVNPDGTITFTPNIAFGGISTLTYTVRDTNGTISNPATVQVTVIQPVPPTVVDDTGATVFPNPVTLDILANDLNGDNPIDPATLTLVTPPPASEGTLVINPDHTVTFTPAPGFIGTSTFTYTVRDTNGIVSNTATGQITTDPSAPPIAGNDAGITLSPNPVVVDLVANDTGVAAPLDPTTIALAAPPPTHGVAVVNPDGTLVFTPDAAFTGLSVFSYTIADAFGVNSNTALVHITVNAVNVPNAPSAPAGNASVGNPLLPAAVSSFHTTHSASSSPVGMSYTADQSFISPGATVQLVITITNYGVPLRRLMLENPLMADLEILELSASIGSAAAAGQLVMMQVDELGTGQTVTLTITVRGRTTVTAPFITTEACAGAENLARTCASTVLSRVTSLPTTGESPAWRLPLIAGLSLIGLIGLAAVQRI